MLPFTDQRPRPSSRAPLWGYRYIKDLALLLSGKSNLRCKILGSICQKRSTTGWKGREKTDFYAEIECPAVSELDYVRSMFLLLNLLVTRCWVIGNTDRTRPRDENIKRKLHLQALLESEMQFEGKCMALDV